MLSEEEKAKIREHIRSKAEEIEQQAQEIRKNALSSADVINQVVTMSVNVFTAESDMLVTSVYNMQSRRTLAKPLFQSTKNRVAFYELDIHRQLRQNFNYDVPRQINYQEGQKLTCAYASAGAVVVVGGVVSICMESWIPVAVSALIAGIMAAVVYVCSREQRQNIDDLIQEYLKLIESSMMTWVDSLEEYYDKQAMALERRLLEEDE